MKKPIYTLILCIVALMGNILIGHAQPKLSNYELLTESENSINIGFFESDIIPNTLARTSFNSNAIYFNIGTLILSANYERRFEPYWLSPNISSFVRIGVGGEAHWDGEGFFILAQYGILTGMEKHHLEIALGLNFLSSPDYSGTLPLSGNIGWRIQDPSRYFIFRMGIGWPEIFYLGFGWSFY